MSTDQSAGDFLLFCKEFPDRPVEGRWCGVVVQRDGRDGEVMDAYFGPSEAEMRTWFEGWERGWQSRKFHAERNADAN